MLPQSLLRFSVVLALAGIVMGMAMGITQNFMLVGAHAHLNVGFVTPFLAGLYYHASPAAAQSRLARFQAGAAMLGGVLFPIGIATVILGGTSFLPFVAASAFLVLASVVMLAVQVFRYGLSPVPLRDGATATAS